MSVVSGGTGSYAHLLDSTVPQYASCPVLAGITVRVSPGGWVKTILFNSQPQSCATSSNRVCNLIRLLLGVMKSQELVARRAVLDAAIG